MNCYARPPLSSAPCLVASPLLANAEYAAYKGRDGFLFGVNGHNRGYEAYPEKNLEQQVRLAAEMGSKVYRFNLVPMSLDEFEYLDKVYRTVHAYGMELLLVMEGSHDEYEDIRDHAKMVAKRYAGKINYIQVGNERDIPAMLGASVDGTQKAHYNMSALAASVNQLKAMCEGVREGSPSTKIIINFSYKHTYYLDYLHEQKVDFDIIGWDWYSNMGEYEPTMEKILSFGKEMMVCETNLWDGRDADAETTRSQWLKEFADFIYNYDSPLVKGSSCMSCWTSRRCQAMGIQEMRATTDWSTIPAAATSASQNRPITICRNGGAARRCPMLSFPAKPPRRRQKPPQPPRKPPLPLPQP